MRFFREESGQVLVMTLVCMGILFGALGLAVDVGVLFHARRNMQTAADAAAMAGATELYYNGPTNVTAVANAAAKANGVDSADSRNIVLVTTSPTLTGGYACPSCVEVRLATPTPTVFMAAFASFLPKSSSIGTTGGSNYSSVNVSAMAVAGAPGPSQACAYVMDPTDPDTLWLHGAGDINAPGCTIYVNSNNSAALCVTGNAGKSNFSVLQVVGGQDSKGNCKGDPGPPVNTGAGVETPSILATLPTHPEANCKSVTNVATLSGDLSSQAPGYGKYQCYANGACTTSKKGVITCNPVTLNSVTLGAGIYVFETGVTITGATTIGSNSAMGGATVIVEGTGGTSGIDGGVYDSGTATTFYDYAPTSGTFNGVAIYQPQGNTQAMQLQFGSGSSIFDGAVVAPASYVTLHDQGGAVNATNLIVGSMYLNGTVNLTNYSTYNPLTTPFTQISLVE